MKYITNIIRIIFLAFLAVSAEDVMKITLKGDVSEVKLASLSKIVFSNDTMIALDSFALDSIVKIEIYNDNPVGVGDAIKQTDSKLAEKGNIGFTITPSTLSLHVYKQTKLDVYLYNSKGAKISRLFFGTVNTGPLNLSLSDLQLSSGVYSVVVKTGKEICIRKFKF
ncbi:MAG: hypothetical protein HQK83_09300 [Fibrobacteria bacterium]|nr:hypothetical protein [Fibrobacteria bacterium]